MELKHQWTGTIEDPVQLLKRNRKHGIYYLTLVIIMIIGNLMLFYSYPSLLISHGFIDDLLFYLFFPGICIVLIILGLFIHFRQSYFITLNIMLDQNEIKYWLTNKKLQNDIEMILSTKKIHFEKRKKYYYHVFYNLPENLNLGVAGPIDQGRINERIISHLWISLGNINPSNTSFAKEIQSALDNLDIQDKYYTTKDKNQSTLICQTGGT